MSGREFQGDLFLRRGTQESGRGGVVGGDRGAGLWVQWKLLEDWWREATQSKAQGHQPVQERLLVSPYPALRCSGPALLRKRAGVLCNKGSVHGSCVLNPAQMGPLPGEGSAHVSPMPWEGCVNWLPLFAVGTELLRMQIKITRGQRSGAGSGVPRVFHA